MDHQFTPFERTLFAGSLSNPRAFDREGQTPKQLEKLDSSIAHFLRILSPYFLLGASHKVLEFLLRRYKIHVYNVDAVLECVLPFHETHLFARMLPLLQIDKQSRWGFLRDAQRAEAPLARTTLVKRCILDVSLLEFLSDMINNVLALPHAVAQQKGVITLFTTLAFELIENARSSNQAVVLADSIVRQIVTFILTGLKNPRVPDFHSSAIILLLQLCRSVLLEVNVLNEVLPFVTKHLPENSPASSILSSLQTLSFLFASQNMSVLPIRTLKHLCYQPLVADAIAEFSHQANSTPLLTSFFTVLCASKLSQPNYERSLVSIANSDMHSSHAESLIRGVLEMSIPGSNGADNDAPVEVCVCLVRFIVA